MTRDPTKDSAKKLEKEYGVELVKGDLNDTEFPKSVFEDAYGVFLGDFIKRQTFYIVFFFFSFLEKNVFFFFPKILNCLIFEKTIV